MRAKVITSPDMAMKIVERVAAKHDLVVTKVLCAKRDRHAVACRAEIAHCLKIELNWSARRTGDLLGITHPAVRKLLGSHQIAMRRELRVLPAATLRDLASISADETRRRLADAEGMILYLRGEIDRLTGASISQRLAECFGLEGKLRCAITLGIVAEAYPRQVSAPDMVELYDEACNRLNYGARTGANFNLITKNIAALREHFASLGYADPIASTEGSPGMYRRLTDEAALLLNNLTGTPRLSQLKSQSIRGAA